MYCCTTYIVKPYKESSKYLKEFNKIDFQINCLLLLNTYGGIMENVIIDVDTIGSYDYIDKM